MTVFPLTLLIYFVGSFALSLFYYDYYAGFYLVVSNIILMILIMKDMIFVKTYAYLHKKDPKISLGLGIFQCAYMLFILPIVFFKALTDIVSLFVG